jgi:hypothetical protein
MPGTGNLRHSTLEHVGPGRAYDTDQYCVVCTDAIGGGTSSQPADGLHERFPKYSIRDMVHAQYLLARDGLGLGATTQLALLVKTMQLALEILLKTWQTLLVNHMLALLTRARRGM